MLPYKAADILVDWSIQSPLPRSPSTLRLFPAESLLRLTAQCHAPQTLTQTVHIFRRQLPAMCGFCCRDLNYVSTSILIFDWSDCWMYTIPADLLNRMPITRHAVLMEDQLCFPTVIMNNPGQPEPTAATEWRLPGDTDSLARMTAPSYTHVAFEPPPISKSS